MKTKSLSCEKIDELEKAITKMIEGIPKGILIGFFMPGEEDQKMHPKKRKLL
jgi:hypothetical protein